MAALTQLQDDFADGTLNTTLWSGSYGDPTESGGQAHIPCGTGYAGLKSAAAYTLAGSSVLVRLHAPDPTGATTAAASVFVLSSTGGTDAGYIVDAAQDAVGLYLREGYADGAAVFLTYSDTDHAWLRLRESAGTLLWETSPDGSSWTVRRSAASPAWLADPDLAFLIEGHRDAGATTSIDIDSVNVPPPTTLTALQETDQALSPALRKTLALDAITLLTTPQPLTSSKALALAPAAETSTVPSPTGHKTRQTGPAAETGTPQPVTPAKTLTLAPAQAASAVQPLTPRKTSPLAPATETNTPRPLYPANSPPVDGLTTGTPRTSWTAGTPRT
ncbi:hypothetical protein OG235_24695 [Streptomyces sp. NBC_00024]|uniref:hypothetical protein n=1 Tax=Streptomyces sp. NBC_00024 TaxID=2903612 RepID=UPI00324E2787